jgi:uncharacterized protein
MSNIIIFLLTIIINSYKYLVSPLLGNRCRYYPSCSDYFVKSLNELGIVKGLFFGIKRILSCHPLKFLGGGSGIDLVPKKKFTKGKI